MAQKQVQRRFAPDLMSGQVALVTGSGSGMGRATALEMASCGARLALFARREEPLQETAEMIRAIGGEALVVPGDTRNEASVEAAMLKIRDHYGRLDVLVNNAGGQYIAAARDITNKGFEAVIRNNLIGSWQMTRGAADHFMFENGGSIVFVTAISTRTALTGFAHTVAARAGITGMMKTLAAEWGEYGIRLNCVAPGTIKTEALGRYPIPPQRWHELNRSVLNRIGAPEDVIADRVTTVTLSDPDRRNPVTGNEMIAGPLDAFDRAQRNPEVSVMILTGADPAFCAGGDIKEMADPESRRDPLASAEGYVKGIQRIPLALCKLNIPMIAAVNGPAVGGGCDLMMYDMRIASERAKFGEELLNLGSFLATRAAGSCCGGSATRRRPS